MLFLTVVLICIFLLTNEIEHLFMCLFAIQRHFLVKFSSVAQSCLRFLFIYLFFVKHLVTSLPIFFLLFSCWVLRVFFNMYPGYIFFIGCNLQIFNPVFSFSWHHGFVWKGFLRKFILKILLSLFFHVEGGSEMPTLEFFKTFYFVLLLLLLLLLLSRFSRVWLCATP